MLKTALVLSAGGMFGAYQAGAWRALAEGFQPEMVIGVSAGALNGWAIAGGCSPDELIEQWLNPVASELMRVDRSRRPWRGLFDPRPLEELVRRLFARYTPRIPFAALLCELPRLRPRLVRSGELTWRHLMASCAVPLGFPNVEIDGRRYCDGGLLNALPIWAAAELGASRAIAVNALPMLPSRLIRGIVKGLRWLAGARFPCAQLEVVMISPGAPLGSLQDAIHWKRENAQRWIERGERDARAGVSTFCG